MILAVLFFHLRKRRHGRKRRQPTVELLKYESKIRVEGEKGGCIFAGDQPTYRVSIVATTFLMFKYLVIMKFSGNFNEIR